MKEMIAVSLEAVHTHTHTHTDSLIKNNNIENIIKNSSKSL